MAILLQGAHDVEPTPGEEARIRSPGKQPFALRDAYEAKRVAKFQTVG